MKVRKISSYRDILAVCDSDLLGKVFDSGNSEESNSSQEGGKKEVQTQLEVKESFFNGPGTEEKGKEETREIMKDMKKEDATFNLVGEKTINTALEAEIIKEDDVRKIQGIPYSMILL